MAKAGPKIEEVQNLNKTHQPTLIQARINKQAVTIRAINTNSIVKATRQKQTTITLFYYSNHKKSSGEYQ